MRNFGFNEEKPVQIFDEIDMRNNYGRGYWQGVISSGVVLLIAFALIGLFVH